jgi:hypothetical protein
MLRYFSPFTPFDYNPTNLSIQVGGLPLGELNHLELQFLILNDFRLSVPVEELEAYGTMLVQFYAREAIANANLSTQSLPPPNPASPAVAASTYSGTASA